MGRLTETDIADIKARLQTGEFQHVIAADYGVNQGRVCEVNRGQRGAHIAPKCKEIGYDQETNL